MGASSDRSTSELIGIVLADGAEARRSQIRRRLSLSLGFSASICVVWAVVVTIGGWWPRLGEHWVAALTMVFGSLVAGATPQGGGAVAFPVFTKGLDVPAEAARSFSLCIQAVGMGSASVSILINRRVVEWRSAITGAAVGSTTLIATLVLLGDPSAPYWPIDLPGPYVKVTFTMVLCAMAWVVLLARRVPVRPVSSSLPAMQTRLRVALIVAGAIGGIAAALVGSGVDLMVYLFVVVLFGVRAGVGVPTSVIAMALVSMVGLVVLGIADQQFVSQFDGDGLVTAIGGEPLGTAIPKRRADLFGMWLAAVPVVAWGAPIGSLVASRMSARSLVTLVITLATAETLSTIVFLEDLRTDPALVTYAVVGLITTVGGLTLVATHRHRLFGLPPLASGFLLTRENVEVSERYRDGFDT